MNCSKIVLVKLGMPQQKATSSLNCSSPKQYGFLWDNSSIKLLGL